MVTSPRGNRSRADGTSHGPLPVRVSSLSVARNPPRAREDDARERKGASRLGTERSEYVLDPARDGPSSEGEREGDGLGTSDRLPFLPPRDRMGPSKGSDPVPKTSIPDRDLGSFLSIRGASGPIRVAFVSSGRFLPGGIVVGSERAMGCAGGKGRIESSRGAGSRSLLSMRTVLVRDRRDAFDGGKKESREGGNPFPLPRRDRDRWR